MAKAIISIQAQIFQFRINLKTKEKEEITADQLIKAAEKNRALEDIKRRAAMAEAELGALKHEKALQDALEGKEGDGGQP